MNLKTSNSFEASIWTEFFFAPNNEHFIGQKFLMNNRMISTVFVLKYLFRWNFIICSLIYSLFHFSIEIHWRSFCGIKNNSAAHQQNKMGLFCLKMCFRLLSMPMSRNEIIYTGKRTINAQQNLMTAWKSLAIFFSSIAIALRLFESFFYLEWFAWFTFFKV